MAAVITTETFGFCQVTTGLAGVPIIPTKAGSGVAALPFANTRQIVILNTSTNPILFSVIVISAQSNWPTTFGGTGPALTLTEGVNCTRIPAGASLTIDLGSYQERGNFLLGPGYTPPAVPLASEFPTSLMTFASTAAGVATADITYVNKYGQF
jgi:hypothetical protein